MDPDENLMEIRTLVAKAHKDGRLSGPDSLRLADLVDALDGWLTGGGFLPKEWSR